MVPNSRTPRIIGRVVKTMAVILILSVCGVLIWRITTSKDPKGISTLIPNDALCEAYEEHGDALLMRYQYQDTITRVEDYNAGYFSVTQYVFIPEANQVQLVFRYNDSTITNVASDKNINPVPSKDTELFDVTLVLSRDLTPEIREDNYGEDGETPETLELIRVTPTKAYTVRETTTLYTYYRYVFEGITLSEDIVGVFVDFNYLGDLSYDAVSGQTVYPEKSYGTLCLYDDESNWIEQKVSKNDRKALLAYGKAD